MFSFLSSALSSFLPVFAVYSSLLPPPPAPPTLTLWVGTASGHTVTYGISTTPAAGGGGGGEGDRRGSGGSKVKKRTVQLMPTGTYIHIQYENRIP